MVRVERSLRFGGSYSLIMKMGGLGVRERRGATTKESCTYASLDFGPILYCKFVSNAVAFHWPIDH